MLAGVRLEDFRSRALGEGLRYGENRSVFLRELAQNSRDAGASRIGVATFFEGGDVVVSFGDDGSGMSFEHARRYLFTLYASSKEEEQRSAGRYGVGFWSVLLFAPDRISIESLTEDGESWAIVFDGALEGHRRVDCGLNTPGTRITLRKRADRADAERTMIELERSLGRYCRYLRRNDKKASPLSVHLNGRRIDKKIGVAGPCWLSFRDGAVEGAVGLGDKPRVELYARGLLVWRGTSLDELRHGASSSKGPSHPHGLAPVYVLNGNDLSVTLDRRAVVDDRALSRVRSKARRRMRELVGRYLDGISPRPFHERIADGLRGSIQDLRAEGLRLSAWAGLGLALALAILAGVGVDWIAGGQGDQSAPPETGEAEIAPAVEILPGRRDEPPASRALEAAGGFSGPMVHPLGRAVLPRLAYRPSEREVLLRTIVADRLDPSRGITAKKPRPIESVEPFRCAARCVSIEAEIDADGGFFSIPTPTGHRVDTGRVWLAGELITRLLATESGQVGIPLDRAVSGSLTYRTGPSFAPLPPRERRELLEVPSRMRLPPRWAGAVARAASIEDVSEQVELIRSFVEKEIFYDRGSRTVLAYRARDEGKIDASWVEFVTAFGRGDCDVKNGLAVLMLRRAGVPARMAVGLAGRGGKALPGRHAWVEYHDGGWIAADATGAAPGSGPLLAVVAGEEEGPEPIGSGQGAAAKTEPDASPAAPTASTRVANGAAPDLAWLGIAAAVAAAVAAFALALALVALIAGRAPRKLVAPGGRNVWRRVASEMLSGALAHPDIWLKSSGLASRRMLPVLGGRRAMSLDEARRLGKSGRLWFSKGGSSLARRAVKNKARVLDSSDEAFGDLVRRLPGADDLDAVAALRPTRAEKLHPSERRVGELIEDADSLIGLGGAKSRTALPCPGLKSEPFRDVDLRNLGVKGPVTFVAVSTRHDRLRSLAGLRRRDPELASFLLLDLLVARSGLLGADAREIRRQAARRVTEATR
ncbi:MAG: transglutaminase domain-containing protein [Polyangia bacterium]